MTPEQVERIKKRLANPVDYLPISMRADLSGLVEAVLGLMNKDISFNMAVARLGGRVEGLPTGKHNFLQRVDALVKIEEKLKLLQNAVVALRACFTHDRQEHQKYDILVTKAKKALEDLDAFEGGS